MIDSTIIVVPRSMIMPIQVQVGNLYICMREIFIDSFSLFNKKILMMTTNVIYHTERSFGESLKLVREHCESTGEAGLRNTGVTQENFHRFLTTTFCEVRFKA